MGWGDEIMVTALARTMRLKDPRVVRVLDRQGGPRWCELWEHSPHIAQPEERGDFQTLVNGPGARAYIEAKTATRWTWRKWDITPGEITLSKQERTFSARHANRIIIEPNLKPSANPNKQWGWHRWQRLVVLAGRKGVRFTQVGPHGVRLLDGVDWVETHDFREACAVMAGASAAVLGEGGLHHAAAAFSVPAVVIFGGYISPDITGYSLHTNIFTGGKACGSRRLCSHCSIAMANIPVEQVLESLLVLTGRGQTSTQPLFTG